MSQYEVPAICTIDLTELHETQGHSPPSFLAPYGLEAPSRIPPDMPPSPTFDSQNENYSIPPSPTLSNRSSVHFATSLALRDNKPESRTGLTSLGLLNPIDRHTNANLYFSSSGEGSTWADGTSSGGFGRSRTVLSSSDGSMYVPSPAISRQSSTQFSTTPALRHDGPEAHTWAATHRHLATRALREEYKDVETGCVDSRRGEGEGPREDGVPRHYEFGSFHAKRGQTDPGTVGVASQELAKEKRSIWREWKKLSGKEDKPRKDRRGSSGYLTRFMTSRRSLSTSHTPASSTFHSDGSPVLPSSGSSDRTPTYSSQETKPRNGLVSSPVDRRHSSNADFPGKESAPNDGGPRPARVGNDAVSRAQSRVEGDHAIPDSAMATPENRKKARRGSTWDYWKRSLIKGAIFRPASRNEQQAQVVLHPSTTSVTDPREAIKKSIHSDMEISPDPSRSDVAPGLVPDNNQESLTSMHHDKPYVSNLTVVDRNGGDISDNVYQNLFALLMSETGSNSSGQVQTLRNTLQETTDSMKMLDPVSRLVRSHQYRVQLLQLASDLRISDTASIRKALRLDETGISNVLRGILASDVHKKAVLCLKGDEAQCLLDLIQTVLDKGSFSSREDEKVSHDAHRLLVRLSMSSDILPTSLSITGVTLLEKEAVFGGGFADIYRGSYHDTQVALKRMRVFQRGNERHKILRMICREALVWQRIKHPYVLPFLGIDSEVFPSFICLVSPWMEHGTILNHMEENGNINIDQRIFEVAQGLEYLHSQNVIHGDLRGANILIDVEWRAQIADFGLTVLAGTVPSHTSNSGGSTRWMAPELHNPEFFGSPQFQRTRASDVYALACTCLEIYTGCPPFLDISNDATVTLMVMNGERPPLPLDGLGQAMPDALWSIVVSSWSQYPADRPSMSQVVELMKTNLQLCV